MARVRGQRAALCRLTETDETKEARAFAQLIREQRRAGRYGSDA
jgi:hypothetical protein